MKWNTIIFERFDQIARVTLNRPEVMNALDRRMRRELMEALATVESDPGVRAVILTGSGRAFSAGADIKESAHNRPTTPAGWREELGPFIDEALKIWNHPKPVIAAVNGHALGAGCDLVLAADIAIAAADARFGEPEIAFYSAPSVLLMPWVVGIKKAKELLLTGATIDAVEAERIGIINAVVAKDQLEAAAVAMAQKIAKVPELALRFNKIAINGAYDIQGLQQALRYSLELSIATYLSESAEERQARMRFMRAHGLKAFHEVGYDKAVEIGRSLAEPTSPAEGNESS